MYCNCNNWEYNLPCCCPPSGGTTTTTTITTCVGGELCEETILSDCVTYSGIDLTCYLIFSGMTLTEILEIIMTQLLNCAPCPTTTTTTEVCIPCETTTTTEPTTTTTTTLPPCNCFTVTNDETDLGDVPYAAEYSDCENISQTVLIPYQTSASFCALIGTISINFTGTIVNNGDCGLECPPLG